jgi:1,4-alpha-glucan branching enzyme
MSQLKIIQQDTLLMPYASALEGRHNYALQKENELLRKHKSLSDFAVGYLYFGLHKVKRSWFLREWAPNATAIYLIGNFNNWEKDEKFRLKQLENGVWEGVFHDQIFKHGDLYKLFVEWENGCGERIPAWATRVVQDENTKIFSAQVWYPDNPYNFKIKRYHQKKSPLLIYECHIGMATNEEKVGTYNEFREKTLPRIVKDGYNCIQIMAIQEHPYYGSFGYHVSSFFAPSSRFGTPDELKQLIDEAHRNNVIVIMDIVHSHAVKNEVEGLGRFDGTPYQYFHGGARREHPAWDSLCFDYAKNEVLHFLLSNCKYWLEEFNFDGFRFDGVTSMIYRDHGLGVSFASYENYYNFNQDGDAICYLTLANKLVHEVNPNAITIAEEMSGLPELAVKFEDGGIGFDYRMAMGIPDFWIKYIKEVSDEYWSIGHIFWELTNRRADEKTVSYAESHDQALVGDKTIIFRLIDADMYWNMQKDAQTLKVSRGVALHKIIRMITATTINGAYLNFMGNEFGHPEWIDFPREGNGWSYKYAKRQWELADNEMLLYSALNAFDNALMKLIGSVKKFNEIPLEKIWNNEGDKVFAYRRKDFVFVYNLNPRQSFTDYGILVKKGSYKVVLNTDAVEFGGFGLTDDTIIHHTLPSNICAREWLMLYLPSRSAVVLKMLGN